MYEMDLMYHKTSSYVLLPVSECPALFENIQPFNPKSRPQSVKKDILFLRQFLIQKKGLKFRKDILFSAVGQFFHNIPTWLKRHITTKYQVSKVHFARYLSIFFFAFFSIKRNITSENRKKPSWYINCSVNEDDMAENYRKITPQP
jgi:hypothetical protein